MNQIGRKALSLLLTLAMLFSLMAIPAYAMDIYTKLA